MTKNEFMVDNQQEKVAKYDSKFVFYSKGLDEQAIKNIFSTSEVVVYWTANNNKEEKTYKLGEVIQFK